MRQKFTFSTSLLIFIFSYGPKSSLSQAGTLDSTFDTDGKVITEIGDSDDYVHALGIQPDGKIVVGGYSDNGSQDVFVVVRYNTDGSLDNTFDGDGIVITEVGTSGGRVHALALQSDGKIILAGYSYNGTDNDFALVRYNTNGSIDNSFDTDGYVTTGFDQYSNDRAFAVTLQEDGKILVAGYHTNDVSDRDFALVRYNTDGSLDVTFGGGIVTTTIAPGGDEAHSVLVQSDGKIVVVGFSFDFDTRVFAVARYNTDGTLDNTFDTDGIVTTSLSDNDDASYAASLQSDGKIVVAGYTHGDSYDFALVRYNIDGSIDNTFETDGVVITSIGTSATSADTPFALTIQNDGKIIATGFAQNDDNDFALVRYNTDGSFDDSFGMDGVVTTAIDLAGSEDEIHAVLLQSDGKIVAAGSTNSDDNSDFAIARYQNTTTIGIIAGASNDNTFNLFPNPFSVQTTLYFNEPLNNVSLKMYNVMGEQIKQLMNVSGKEIILNRDNISCGIYYIEIADEYEIIATDKIVIGD